MLQQTIGHVGVVPTRRLLRIVTATIALSAVTAVVVGVRDARVDVVPVHTGPNPPGAYFRVDGRLPTAFPDDRLAIGFLQLNQPIERAAAVLGPSTTTGPDVMGPAFTWALPGGAALTVSADAGRPQSINGLYVEVPRGSPTRFAAYGDVVIGRSTLADVVDAWGPGYARTSSPFDDFVVRYVACVGSAPVVIKFDQGRRTDLRSRIAPDLQWEQPVTSLLVAYADEPPGSAGCPAPVAGGT
jgi:hypothetical protein